MNADTLLFEEETKSQQLEVSELQDECKTTIKNTLKIAANANEISRYGATKLNEQTEQLHRIENETEKIKDNLDKTEEAIASLKNPLLFWFKGLFRQNRSSMQNLEKKSQMGEERSFGKNVIEKNLVDVSNKEKKNLVNYKEIESNLKHNSKEKSKNEIDNGLDQIGDLLKEMHSRAINMNNTLKNQNGIMEKIHSNVHENNSRMKDQRKDLGKFI